MGRVVGVGMVVWAAVALGACKDKSAEQAATEQRASDPLARVSQIAATLPEIRRLSMDRPIPAARQSGADFRNEVHKSVAEQPAVGHAGVVLRALGLIDPKVDVAKGMEDTVVSQAAAYYDPRAKKFQIVMSPQNELLFDAIAAHELTHGIQDQHFDIQTYLEGTKDAPLDGDAKLARRFITEGDASFTSAIFVAYTKTHQTELTGEQVKYLRNALAKFDALDGNALAALLKQQMASADITDPEIKRAIDAIPTLPPVLLEPFLLPYFKGASVVAEAYADGGWKSVNNLYAYPPQSTAQVLHAKEQLIGSRHFPRKVSLPSYSEVEVVDTDVLGELMWGIYFQRWKHAGVAHPEEGWNGDRYAVLRDDDGGIHAIISTVWDSEPQARAFYEAYLSTLAVRYPDKATRDTAHVRLIGDRVLIVDGGESAVLDDLAAQPVK